MVLGGSDTVATGPYHAPPRLQPPLVSFIALLGGVLRPALRLPVRLLAQPAGDCTVATPLNGTHDEDHASSRSRDKQR